MGDTGKQRLFVAVNLSLATTRKIAEVLGRLQRTAPTKDLRVAWVPPSNLHVTLKFLGWTRPETIDAVRDRLEEVTRGRKGFDLGAKGAGAFPNVRDARVLWVGVQDPSGALTRLAKDVDGAMKKVGFEPETRAYHPHVTIGRVKEGRSVENLVAPHLETDFGSSLIREVIIYESIAKPGGSEYIVRHRLPLDAPPYRAERQTRDVETGTTENEEPETHGGQHST